LSPSNIASTLTASQSILGKYKYPSKYQKYLILLYLNVVVLVIETQVPGSVLNNSIVPSIEEAVLIMGPKTPFNIVGSFSLDLLK
jgi:hypothetical protein